MKRKTILLVIALIVVIGGGAVLYGALEDKASLPGPFESSFTPGQQPAEPGDNGEDNDEENAIDERIKAPDFTVVDMDGNDVKLSDMLGKPVVINFWTSWCPFCKLEMPRFNKAFEDMGDKVQFMMVDAVGSRGETKEDGAEYVAEEGFTFPVFFDINQDAVTEYGIRSFPTSIFIDAEGYVVASVEGAIDEETLLEGISLITGTAEQNTTAE